jgi:class 3 adenylate cyclase
VGSISTLLPWHSLRSWYFSQSEWQKVIVAFAYYASTLAAAKIYLAYFPPLFAMSEEALATSHIFALVAVCGFCTATMYYYRASAIAAQIGLYQTNRRLHELLENTLPGLITARLEKGETLIADSHSEAAVLFADLVEFSELSKRLSPSHLVELLNNLFSQFDDAAERHQVEKIKTIGDCYMAATGVLGQGASRVDAIAEFAFDLLRIVRAVGDQSGLPLELRIGISSGPVVSGVIGRRKYSFDLWGDTVNLASRMERDGEPAHIHVTDAIYWRLCRRYRLEKRGEINVKGHPNTNVYDLIGPLDAGSNVVSIGAPQRPLAATRTPPHPS